MALPTNLTTASSGHITHHETIHGSLHAEDTSLPLDVTAGDSGHRAHHASIGALLGLGTTFSTADEHVALHNAIHVQVNYGPRGAYGQQATTGAVPNWPVSFDGTFSTFAALNNGTTGVPGTINGKTSGRVIRITASMAFTAVVAPKANDQFWFDPGVTITRSGAIASAFASNVNGVKIMNGKFSGFNSGGGAVGNFNDKTISSNGGAGWEIAYCEITGTYYPWAVDGPAGGGADGWHVHHNYFHDCAEPGAAFSTNDCVVEDNEFADNGILNTVGGEHKWTGTTGFRFRHNWVHGGSRCGCWYDTANSGSITEWNLFEGNSADVNPCGAIMYEQQHYTNASESVNDNGIEITFADRNICRYNRIQNEFSSAITLVNNNWTEAYGNIVSNCCQTSVNKNYFPLTHDGNAADGQGNHYDLRDNYFHHNQVTLGSATHTLVYVDVVNVTETPYWDNSKNNDFDYNIYEPLSNTTPFYWNHSYRTWAYWQAIPQDVHGQTI